MTLMMREKEKYEEGVMMTLFALVHDELITVEEAAKRASMSEEMFSAKMKEAGYEKTKNPKATS